MGEDGAGDFRFGEKTNKQTNETDLTLWLVNENPASGQEKVKARYTLRPRAPAQEMLSQISSEGSY